MAKATRRTGDGRPGNVEESLASARKSFAESVDELHKDPALRASAVIDRIKQVLGCDSDAELAWVFGSSPQSISNRRKRNSIPYREAVYVALWANASLAFLLTGQEPEQPN